MTDSVTDPRTAGAAAPELPYTLVADVDTGIDDALALLWLASLHRRKEIDLHVTTVAGNTTAATAARNSREVLQVAGVPEVPVTVGAGRPRVLPLTTTPETPGPGGLGYRVPASPATGTGEAEGTGDSGDPGDPGDAVAAWEAASPDRILVAGPATTLAWAVEHRPEVLRGTRVTLMCGAFLYPGNTTPTAEWNAWSDPHALAYCLDNWPASAPLPQICPLNVTETVLLTPQRLEEWTAAAPAEVSVLLDELLRFYMEFHRSVGVGYVAQIHDLAAATVLCSAVPAEFRDATVRVALGDDLVRGTTVADWTGATAQGDGRCAGTGPDPCIQGGLQGARNTEPATGPYWGRPANARILTGLDPETVFARFREALTAPAG